MAENQVKKEKSLSETIKDRVAREVFALRGERPNLAIVVFGDEHEYISELKKLEEEAKKCGIDTNLYISEADSSQTAAEGMIEFLNSDEAIDAIYIQSPVPESVNYERLLSLVGPEKDISLNEDFNSIDWELLQARIFESALERFREKTGNA